MKKIYLFVPLILLLAACGSQTETAPAPDLAIVAPSGAPSLALMRLIYDETQFGPGTTTYEIAPNGEVLTAMVMGGEADLAVVPINLAANLYNQEAGFQVGAVLTWGNLFVVTTDSGLQGWEDLEGRTVQAFGRGLVPDATFAYLLNHHGLDPETSLELNYLPAPAEAAQMLLSGLADTALLPEPLVSRVLGGNDEARVLLDLQAEWQQARNQSFAGYPQSVLIIRQELLEGHPDLIGEILQAIQEGTEWANENPQLLGERAAAMDEAANAGLVAASLAGSHVRFEAAAESRAAIQDYLEALYGISPAFVGGRVPDEGFLFTP